MGLKDVLFGKKDTGTPDRKIALDEDLRRNVKIGRDNQFYLSHLLGGDISRMRQDQIAGVDNEAIAQSQGEEEMQRQLKIADQGGADKEMQARDLIAQRGLGGTQTGLSTILNARDSGVERKNEIMSNLPQLTEGFRAQRLNKLFSLSQGVNQMLGATGAEAPVITGTPGTGRSGGLLAMSLGGAGAAFGAAKGGPAGAAAGYQIGSGAGRSAANL